MKRAGIVAIAGAIAAITCAGEDTTSTSTGDGGSGAAVSDGGGGEGGIGGEPCVANTQVDPDNCGECGTVCRDDQFCQLGLCICTVGEDCDGACVRTDVEVAHCGGCNDACPGMYDVCRDSLCEQDCDFHDVDICGDACADFQTSETHCGGCDMPCNIGYECLAGACGCAAPVCGLCGYADLGSAVPQVTMGTSQGLSIIEPPCADMGGPEIGHLFTAPSDGAYAFDSLGSSFDTVMHVYDATGCALLACNDDYFSIQSLAVVDMAMGEQVLAVVDGFDQAQLGTFSFAVRDTQCPRVDLSTNVPVTVNGDTANAGRYFVGGCGGAFEELTYRFEAPAAGMYSFDTSGSPLGTVLHARDGGCTGPELGCAATTLQLSLSAGQVIMLAVDSNDAIGGTFTLDVTQN